MQFVEPLPGTWDVAIFFALPVEAEPALDRMYHVRRLEGDTFEVAMGEMAGEKVLFAVTGPGRERARRAAEAVLAAHGPRLVVASGFAGGLTERLAPGDVVHGTDVVGEHENQSFPLCWPWGIAPRAGRDGRLLSVDRIIATSQEKHLLGERHGAVACDMETMALGEVCRARGVAIAALRVISDPVDESLPPQLERVLACTTFAGRLGAALGMLARRPTRIRDLWRLRERAFLAADKLSASLLASLPRLAAFAQGASAR